MKLWLIAFTRQGAGLCESLIKGLNAMGHDCYGFAMGEFAGPETTLQKAEPPLADWTGKAFCQAEGIVFIGACGIAVRGIAPYVKSKLSDPAVVAVDEQGRFAVSLLSGHVGGGNRLTVQVAQAAGAVPVVSTATDLNGLFSVDVYAVDRDMAIGSIKLAKRVSAALLERKPVFVKSRFPEYFSRERALPQGLCFGERGDLGICVSLDEEEAPFAETLNLIPRRVVLGVGCRKNTPEELIAAAVNQVLKENKISLKAVKRICSVDLKAEEPGLLSFCKGRGVPFAVYTAQELSGARGEFSSSNFVQDITGVDNVCERAAVLGSGNGRLLVKKRVCPSVTVAAALADIC